MARRKNRPCTRCGQIHGRHGAVCHSCTRADELAAMPVKHCALCGRDVPRDRVLISPYCDITCANAVSNARAHITNIVKRAVRTGQIPPVRSLACVDCGAPATDYDHRHYLEPLAVEPTCRSCNHRRGPAIDVAALVLAHSQKSEGILELMEERRRVRDARDREFFSKYRRHHALAEPTATG